jgi:hypothetical protein
VTRLPDLRAALVAAAQRQAVTAPEVVVAPAGPPRRRVGSLHRVSKLPLLAAIALTVLGLAAVAFAATALIPNGAPVEPQPGQTFTPTSGLGVPIPSSVRLLGSPVPDPAGGPPWGVRYIQTTRGLGCLTVGRIVGGRLGVLGQDGAFNDDGRFHELPVNVLDPFDCAILDAHGHAFFARTAHGMPASAGGGLAPSSCVAPGK